MRRSSRRTFLRGLGGATLALPSLESFAAATKTAAAASPAVRMAHFYVPIGVVRRGFFPGEEDAAIPKFTSSQKEIETDAQVPVGLHSLEQLTPTQQPLERMKDKIAFISGMDRFYKQGSDVHAQCDALSDRAKKARRNQSGVNKRDPDKRNRNRTEGNKETVDDALTAH